jgi:chromosome segregation ATPase
MAQELIHSQEVDLDRTDRLPVLDGSLFDHAVEEDVAALDHTANLAAGSLVAAPAQSEFIRSSGVDLPSLAESVRSVEERIARQNAEYEALTRAFERSRDAEEASLARANALAADLAAARTALESEQTRLRELDRALVERTTAVESGRARTEEALRESNRYQSEARTLRESLTARETAVSAALHSLGERDAQLAALQSEHNKVMPELAATSKSSAQLAAELQSTRAQANSLATELDSTRATAAALTTQLKRGESAIKATRSELGAEKSKTTTFLELLRTRDWRRGFDHNTFREMDAKVSAAYAGQNALEEDRNRLKTQAANLETQLSEQKLATDAERARLVAATEAQRARLVAAADAERARLTAELAAHDKALAEAREHGNGEAARMAELLEASKRRQAEQTAQLMQARAEQAAQIAQLQAEAATQEQEMSVLMVHLKEARRPIESIEADVKRLTEEVAAKVAACVAAEEENRKLTATLERTRGALEEREFLIRRLERSESNNANVLGRIQTSIERLGAVPVGSSAIGGVAPVADWSAELIRIDGERPVTHVLSRRTRIGRAAGCEMQIDSSSVSRHHALVIVGPREAIIEDLNSTNGVLVNGRKISRQMLNDGDAVAIGDIQFRYFARPVPRGLTAKPAEPTA